ncbi:MAG: OmpA family protein [Bacteroidota bacterium]
MKKIFLLFWGLMWINTLTSQEMVSWGTQVVDVSSEYSAYEYSAIQSLYRPNVPPQGGESPNAWRPKKKMKEEFIMVSFGNPIKAKQVAIAESENPGAVKAVYGYDRDYNEYKLFELTPQDLPIESRLLNLFFEETSYEIHAIRIILDCSINEGYNAIDAIGISASNIPINVLINLAIEVNSDINAEKLSTNVNSEYVEHNPLISPDGKKLYFSRQFHPKNVGGVNDEEDIWVSELNEETGEWMPAKNVGPPLNTPGPNFISSISLIDGQEVLLLGNRYGKKGRMYSGVSQSIREGDSFSDPIGINIKNEYNYSPHADFFLTPQGDAIIISAERDDTYGARDLYVTFKQGDESWTEPLNLGENINTTGEDESPFMAKDGKTLFFSTDGYKGYGGSDVYVSFRLDDSWIRWSQPENLGPGINKEGDDEYFSIPLAGQNLYFTRYLEGEDSDVFTFRVEDFFVDGLAENPLLSSVDHLLPKSVDDPLPKEELLITMIGMVVDGKTKQPVGNGSVLIECLPDSADIGRATINNSGEFIFTVKEKAKYRLISDVEGYISEDENLDFTDLNKSDTMTVNLNVFSIKKGETITLNSIIFGSGKSKLEKTSYPELNKILEYMKNGKIEAILIKGHSDSVGDEDYNMYLSGVRAKEVMEFFIRSGISRDRLSYKAFGETQPKTSNDTKEGRIQNRRVEFEIL